MLSMTQLQPVRGTHDVMPEESALRADVLARFAATAQRFGYGRIDTPVFEFSEVFHRTLGEGSDIVAKETYTFTDRGGDSITLRPEFTAAIARAFISHGLNNELPIRWWYAGPAFRYERPQKGRLRQFTQLGAELLGAPEPLADADMIAFAHVFLSSLGLSNHITLELNSLGDVETRARYREALVAYFSAHAATLSEDSKRRLEKNPLRILDSKDEGDRSLFADAPSLHSCFSDAAKAHWGEVQEALTRLSIPYNVSERLVRGLDYYSHTVFEFTSTALGAQNTVLAGGRYDGLIKQMGGADVAGVGFAAGLERLLLMIEASKSLALPRPQLVALIPIGEAAEQRALALAHSLRTAGIAVDMAYKGNAGKRMKRADKLGASHAIIVGDDELAQGTAKIKTLATGEEKTVPLAQLSSAILPPMA